MIRNVAWPAFLAASVAVLAVPGPDLALLTRQTVGVGVRAASLSALGMVTGGVLHATAAVTGVTTLLLLHPSSLTALRIAGAGYLILLGVHVIRAARRPPTPTAAAGSADAGAAARAGAEAVAGRPFLAGLLTNLLNPKVVLFFAVFLPQFATAADRRTTLALLAACYLSLALAWLLGYVHLLSRAGPLLAAPRCALVVQHAAGVVLVALGARLLVSAL